MSRFEFPAIEYPNDFEPACPAIIVIDTKKGELVVGYNRYLLVPVEREEQP